MPQSRGTVRLDTWLTKLLWALAQKNGGELRIAGTDLDDVPERCALSSDYDKATHEIVLRSSSGASEMIVIHTGEQWARPSSPVNPEANSTPSPAPPQSRSAVLSDEDVANVEQRLLRRAAERKRERETAELTRAHRGE